MSSQQINKIKLKLTEDGLRFGDTILSLDSYTKGDLSFISCISDVSQKVSTRMITMEETCKLMQVDPQSSNHLLCQYNRPFSLGRLTIELLPSGGSLGAASLYITHGDQTFFYGCYLQPSRVLSLRQMQLRKADTLVLKTGQIVCDSSYRRRQEQKNFFRSIEKAAAEESAPLIYCPATPTAQELTSWLSQAGFEVAVHPSIFKINKIYEQSGVLLGKYTKLQKSPPSKYVVLLPENISQKSLASFGLLRRKTIHVNCRGLQGVLSEKSESFCISREASFLELVEVIEKVQPSKLFVMGPYAKTLVDRISIPGLEKETLNPHGQVSLF